MAKSKEIKANAMRILDSLKISYESYFYECDEFINAMAPDDLMKACDGKFANLIVS